jgi:hypothetical protein
MGKGEGDDLAEIGGVRQDLLVTGQGRVEDHFGLHLAGGADALAFDHGSICQNEQGSRLVGCPGCCRGHLSSRFRQLSTSWAVEVPFVFASLWAQVVAARLRPDHEFWCRWR